MTQDVLEGICEAILENPGDPVNVLIAADRCEELGLGGGKLGDVLRLLIGGACRVVGKCYKRGGKKFKAVGSGRSIGVIAKDGRVHRGAAGHTRGHYGPIEHQGEWIEHRGHAPEFARTRARQYLIKASELIAAAEEAEKQQKLLDLVTEGIKLVAANK